MRCSSFGRRSCLQWCARPLREWCRRAREWTSDTWCGWRLQHRSAGNCSRRLHLFWRKGSLPRLGRDSALLLQVINPRSQRRNQRFQSFNFIFRAGHLRTVTQL